MQYKIGKIQIDFFKLIKSILKFHTELSIVLPYNFAFSAFDVVILKFARCANCCGWFSNSLFINFCNKKAISPNIISLYKYGDFGE